MIDLIAFLDLETSGLRKPGADEASQPWLLQISVKTVERATRKRVSRFTRIIKPEGFSIEPEAEAVHGISEARAHQVGAPLWFVLAELRQSLIGVSAVVGHGIQGFDRPLIEVSLKRAGAEGDWWRKVTAVIVDTIELATPVLKLPGQFGDYKFPTLEEAVAYFRSAAGEHAGWRSSHDAEDDIEATEFVFWNLVDLKTQEHRDNVTLALARGMKV